MSWFAVALIAIASAAGLFAAGCGGKCPTATFDLRALDDSTVTWSLAGSPPQTTTGFVPGYPPAGTDCTFSFNKGRIVGPVAGRSEALLQGYSSLACNTGGNGTYDFILSDLGDFRGWSMGSFTIFTNQQNFGVDFGLAGGNGCTVGYFDGMAITVTVEAATGGPAPYPKMVTDDLVRTFRLDFDTSSVAPTTSSGAPCVFPVSAQVSVHLTQTAADYVYDANAPCYYD